MTTMPMDATLWRVWRTRTYPWVGGCDRHLSEGWFAVKMVVWDVGTADPSSGTLTITLRGLTTEETTVRECA